MRTVRGAADTFAGATPAPNTHDVDLEALPLPDVVHKLVCLAASLQQRKRNSQYRDKSSETDRGCPALSPTWSGSEGIASQWSNTACGKAWPAVAARRVAVNPKDSMTGR